MAESQKRPISFDIAEEHRKALETISGGRPVRVLARVQGGRATVDFVACNAAFVACNTAFTACNTAFTACNTAFKKT